MFSIMTRVGVACLFMLSVFVSAETAVNEASNTNTGSDSPPANTE